MRRSSVKGIASGACRSYAQHVKAWLVIVGLSVLCIGDSVAFGCLMGPELHVLDPDEERVETEAPSRPVARLARIGRGAGMSCCPWPHAERGGRFAWS